MIKMFIQVHASAIQNGLPSKIVYVMFSCKNSLIRGKLHTLYLSGKMMSKEKGTLFCAK